MRDLPSVQLLEMLRQGNQQAAAVLEQRYARRLIYCVRQRLAEKLGRRFDAEDVCQSAWRSFFRGAANGTYPVYQQGETWMWLVRLGQRKLHRFIEEAMRAKRNPDREQAVVDVADPEPTVEQIVAATDQVEHFLGMLTAQERQVVELWLLDWTQEEIAVRVQRSARRVRGILKEALAELRQRAAQTAEE